MVLLDEIILNEMTDIDDLFKSKLYSKSGFISKYLSTDTDLSKFVAAFKEALNLQICFIIDCTGSIAKHKGFKNNIFGLIMDALLDFMNNESSRRYAFIGYRERDENNEFHDFSFDKDKIMDKIKNVSLTGGGDDCEDVEYALEKFCNEINFVQGGTRIIIHIADEPCHGMEYHDNHLSDKHPEWSKNIPKLLKKISNNFNCAYWFVKITNDTDKMIKKFDQILDENCPNSDFNKITVLDLRNLNNDEIKNVITEQLFKTTLASTKISLNK